MRRLAHFFLLTMLSLLCLPLHQLEVRAQSVEGTIENTALQLTFKVTERKTDGLHVRSNDRLGSSVALAPKQFAYSEVRDTSGAPIEVMVLGTFHFEGAPGFNDMMAPEQQDEIRAVVDSLAGFRPTKIALEATVENAPALDSLYDAYRVGTRELNSNERQQLGFRLARRLGHDRVYAIDYKQAWPFGEVMTWAREHEPSFIDYYNRWREELSAVQDSLHRHDTVGEFLCWLNSSAYSSRVQEVQMRRLELGADSTYVGLKPITTSYERNLRIFANLTRIAEPGDRILVIYGATHGYMLRAFARQHPDMTLVNAREYL